VTTGLGMQEAYGIPKLLAGFIGVLGLLPLGMGVVGAIVGSPISNYVAGAIWKGHLVGGLLSPGLAFPDVYTSFEHPVLSTKAEIQAAIAIRDIIYRYVIIPATAFLIMLHAIGEVAASMGASMKRIRGQIIGPMIGGLLLAAISTRVVDVVLDLGRTLYLPIYPEISPDMISLFTVKKGAILFLIYGYLNVAFVLSFEITMVMRFAYILFFIAFAPIASILLISPWTRKYGMALWSSFLGLTFGLIPAGAVLAVMSHYRDLVVHSGVSTIATLPGWIIIGAIPLANILVSAFAGVVASGVQLSSVVYGALGGVIPFVSPRGMTEAGQQAGGSLRSYLHARRVYSMGARE